LLTVTATNEHYTFIRSNIEAPIGGETVFKFYSQLKLTASQLNNTCTCRYRWLEATTSGFYTKELALYLPISIDTALNTKQNVLTFSPTVPLGATTINLTGIKDGDNYYIIPAESDLEVVPYQTTTALTDEQLDKAMNGKLAVLYVKPADNSYVTLLTVQRVAADSDLIKFGGIEEITSPGYSSGAL